MYKNYIALSIVFCLFYMQLSAQKMNLGLSFSCINDYNWNRPLNDLLFCKVVLYSGMPVSLGVTAERQYKVISPSVGLNFMTRNIQTKEFFLNGTGLGYYRYNTLELPINFTYRKYLDRNICLTANLGIGLNYVFAQTSKTTSWGIASESLQIKDQSGNTIDSSSFYYQFQFSILNPNKITWFLNGGIGLENKFAKAGTIQIRFQFTGFLKPWLQYRFQENYIINNSEYYSSLEQTSLHSPYYTTTTITYYFPWFKKSSHSQNNKFAYNSSNPH